MSVFIVLMLFSWIVSCCFFLVLDEGDRCSNVWPLKSLLQIYRLFRALVLLIIVLQTLWLEFWDIYLMYNVSRFFLFPYDICICPVLSCLWHLRLHFSTDRRNCYKHFTLWSKPMVSCSPRKRCFLPVLSIFVLQPKVSRFHFIFCWIKPMSYVRCRKKISQQLDGKETGFGFDTHLGLAFEDGEEDQQQRGDDSLIRFRSIESFIL